MNLRGQYFDITIDEISGSFRNYRASIEYYINENIVLGLGYNDFSLDVGVIGSQFQGGLEWKYQGFNIFVSMRI